METEQGRVLIVDSNEATRHILASQLEQLNYMVEIVNGR